MVDGSWRQDDHAGEGCSATRLFAGLPWQLGVSAVRVFGTTAAGDVLLHASGDGPIRGTYPLRSGLRVVGRLELSDAGLRTMTALDPLLPWISLAVEHVVLLAHERRRVAELSRLRQDDVDSACTARLRRAVETWGLSEAQAGVLEGVVRGLSTADIAARLGCVEATVELHVVRLMRGAGASSRADVVARFWAFAP